MIRELNTFLNLFLANVTPALQCIGMLWIIHIINITSGSILNALGIIPRFLPSLIWGPFLSPLLHLDFNHLLFNSTPLFFLLCILFSLGYPKALCVLLTIALYSGLMTWLFARKAIHIGASAVISGLMSFFAYRTYLNPDITGLVVVITLVYYFGSIFLSFIPTDEKTSSEGHLFGLISGYLVAVYGCPSLLMKLSTSVLQLLM